MNDANPAVFLSYASQDADSARRICEALRTAGIEVWFDQSELRGGDAWDAAIRKQIKACVLFIPVISRNTHAREEGYFRLEWKLAVDRSHLMTATKAFLVPVVIDATRDDDEHVPERFREVQWTRLPGGQTPAAFVERVGRLLSGARDVAPRVHGALRGKDSPMAKSIALTLLLGLLIAAGVYLVVDRLVPERPAASGGSLAAVSPHSIAVLPFSDLSEKKDQEYFSDGLAETVLGLLAKTPGLHVIARTSSFSFKGKTDDIPTIAQKLHVANLLEGSVRKAGNHLRVSTQLIRADSGEHLWSETYDRDLADVFKVQDDIAAAVVAALKLKLSPAQESASHGTSNPDAYNEYLRGREFFNRDNTQSIRLALESFHKVIALDAHYAAAYAALAVAEWDIADDSAERAGYARALAAADKAIELAPSEPEGYSARGLIRTLVTWDWAGAQADFEKALALDPGDAVTYSRYGFLLATLGRMPESLASMTRSVELDPLSGEAWQNLARTSIGAHDLAAARAANRRALEIAPESTRDLYILGWLQLIEGQAAEALLTFRRSEFPAFRLLGASMAEHTLRHDTESKQALDELAANYSKEASYQVAQGHAWRGEKDLAFAWLDRAYSQRDTGLTLIKYDSFVDSLRADPRFRALLHRMNLPE
ncbi:MAG: TIR domain-containing protein [Steroidobacterales bacterium]